MFDGVLSVAQPYAKPGITATIGILIGLLWMNVECQEHAGTLL